MNKQEIKIPDGIKFINELSGYTIPPGHVIVDKGICGCGYTHFCLTNNIPTILCSPRKLLLENKMDQIPGLYYFQNDKESTIEYDKLSADKDDIQVTIDTSTEQEKEEYIKQLKTQLYNWIINNKGVPKILVTYDSLPHVLDIIRKFPTINFQIVVDEFQSIFTDANFKAGIELDFVEYLQDCPNVCYLSATPMLEKYLDQLEYFKSLPFQKLIWPSTAVSSVNIHRKFTQSIVNSCKEIIDDYKSGNRPSFIDNNKIKHESNEVVFFVNSVKTICDIIKKSGLSPNETNIICARSPYNLRKIKKLGSGFNYGRIPKRDELNKMFTFCTRTAYLGADFYSTNAYTVICSSLNIKTMVLDISLDLPQIMGRQRRDDNPWKNECILFYCGRTRKDITITYSDFVANVQAKEERSKNLLSLFDKATGAEKTDYISKLQRDKELYIYDYVGISKKQKKPLKNYLVQISELRAWEISQPDYQDNVLVKKDGGDVVIASASSEIKNIFNSTGSFSNKMRYICKYLQSNKTIDNNILQVIPKEYLNYINALGPDRIISLGCEELSLQKEIYNIQNYNNISKIIISCFNINNNYLLSDIKNTIQKIYDDNGIQKKAKASDIEDYFEVTKIQSINKLTGKRDNGYKLLKLK